MFIKSNKSENNSYQKMSVKQFIQFFPILLMISFKFGANGNQQSSSEKEMTRNWGRRNGTFLPAFPNQQRSIGGQGQQFGGGRRRGNGQQRIGGQQSEFGGGGNGGFGGGIGGWQPGEGGNGWSAQIGAGGRRNKRGGQFNGNNNNGWNGQSQNGFGGIERNGGGMDTNSANGYGGAFGSSNQKRSFGGQNGGFNSGNNGGRRGRRWTTNGNENQQMANPEGQRFQPNMGNEQIEERKL